LGSTLQAQLNDKQVEEAEKLYNEGEYKSVIKLLKPAAVLKVINTHAEMLLGDSYHKQEDFVDAIEHYDRAEDGGDESFNLYFHRARAYISIQEYKKGSKDMDKAIEMKPNDADLYFFRAFAESEMNHLEKALKDYDKAIELNPEFQNAYFNRASTKMELERFDGVVEDVNKSKELGLESEDIDLVLAQLTYEEGKYEEALPMFMKIIENSTVKEDKAFANYYIAECYYALDDETNACVYFYKAMKLGDQDAQETYENFCNKDQLRTLFKPRKKLEKVSF
jgi:tetratricopeptide (TPR) repeat protein